MNNPLKREIILHILKSIGIFADPQMMKLSMMEKLNSNKFLLNKKLAFETEDEKTKESNLYCATAKIESSNIKIIIADISEDLEEVALIIQMDIMNAYAIRLSADSDDFGSMYVNVNGEHWVAAPLIQQAKMLVGFESLLELFLVWEKLDDYKEMYKTMVGFLNFYEAQE
jgi:hypothetical protein